jgi:hypothetical protein
LDKKWYAFGITITKKTRNYLESKLQRLQSLKSKLSHHVEGILLAIHHMEQHMKNYAKYKTFGKTFLTIKSRLVVNWLCNLDLQNVKKLKHHSSSTLPSTCTIANLTNSKYSRKEQASTLDVEIMC